MWIRCLLGAVFILMLLGAFICQPEPQRSPLGAQTHGTRLRLLSWNIGYGDLELDSRARREDLPSIAQVILSSDPDAIALQELTGEDQLKILLSHLQNRYTGYVTSFGSADRVCAVLVRDRHARFNEVQASDKFAAAATFQLQKGLPEVLLISAHADAFSSSRRRTFVADLTDWVRGRSDTKLAFIAGDFNFEVSVRNKTNLFTDSVKHDSEAYSSLSKYFRDLARDAGETSINDRRIDYIFGPQKGVSVRRAEVLRGTAIGHMDHWPLLVELDLHG